MSRKKVPLHINIAIKLAMSAVTIPVAWFFGHEIIAALRNDPQQNELRQMFYIIKCSLGLLGAFVMLGIAFIDVPPVRKLMTGLRLVRMIDAAPTAADAGIK